MDPKMEVKPIFCPSPVQNTSPLKPIFYLKNREQIKKFEEKEECFILEFDPYNNSDVLKLPTTVNGDNVDADLSVVSEKGQCYCYVCDLSAPCLKWTGTVGGHCHAFSNEEEGNEATNQDCIA
ncbi:hypothetical protein SASPL_137605 [Salvia splendens]|uniref:Uncharacterized protein n=1 Tax=Salvia splendens TaxID=180675 RepID=A0A8X8WTP2_SALSN|nr:hypothetical protein SASPL_137605 [Salvia splendens]